MKDMLGNTIFPGSLIAWPKCRDRGLSYGRVREVLDDKVIVVKQSGFVTRVRRVDRVVVCHDSINFLLKRCRRIRTST